MDTKRDRLLVIHFETGPIRQITGFPAVLVSVEKSAVIGEFYCRVSGGGGTGDEKSWFDTMGEFETWCTKNGVESSNTLIVTSGDWDMKTILPAQLSATRTRLTPFLFQLFRRWTNTKTAFSVACKTKPLSIPDIIKHLGLPDNVPGDVPGATECSETHDIVRICLELTRRGHDMTEQTSQWSPKTLWYDLYRYSIDGQTTHFVPK